MSAIGNKGYLADNLLRMYKLFPKEFNFFPLSFNLPRDVLAFERHAKGTGEDKPLYIVKPCDGCQGKGIFLTKDGKDIDKKSGADPTVAQEYIADPLLIDGHKFDLRVYVLLLSVNPITMYLYDDGLTRLCTEQYEAPTNENLDNLFMHLTNYSINKHSEKFVLGENDSTGTTGHKRSILWFRQYLKRKGHDADLFWKRVGDVAVKTIISVQPQLHDIRLYSYCRLILYTHTILSPCTHHTRTTLTLSPYTHHTHHTAQVQPQLNDIYKSSTVSKGHPNSCFEILGFDLLVDSKLKPWLIEVNHSHYCTHTTVLIHCTRTTVLILLSSYTVLILLSSYYYCTHTLYSYTVLIHCRSTTILIHCTHTLYSYSLGEPLAVPVLRRRCGQAREGGRDRGDAEHGGGEYVR
jgi:hypothetical protein